MVSLVLPLLGALLGEQLPDCSMAHVLWQPQAKSPFLGIPFRASFPALLHGIAAALSHPQSSCDPSDSKFTLSRYGSTPLSHLSDVPHQSRLLKVPKLYSTAILLASSQFTEAPHIAPAHFIFPYITMDSLLHTSFVESGQFSIAL